jgi:uncharacterized protein GlcG (DUF336 family)
MRTADARRALEAARSEAERIGKPVAVAVVDATAMLVVFERFENAPAFNGFVAEGKACASAFTGRDSSALKAMVESFPALATSLSLKLNGRFVPIQGAVVLRDGGGAVTGAIGVSGAAAAEDEQIARAGADAFNA